MIFDLISELAVAQTGGPRPVLHEPRAQVAYLSVFIQHFLSVPAENLAILRKLYIDNSLSTYQIEEITDSSWSKTAIADALRKSNIARERVPSRLSFGEKFVGGQRVPHLAEQKVIQKIITLRGSEMSYRAIADYLNQRNTPTKLRSKWNKTTVGDILKRHLKR
jgi:hypothetical protein